MTGALLAALCYLLGSLVVGIIVSRLKGGDIRERDLPGASGVFRQYGPAWGVATFAGDVVKGVAGAYLASLGDAAWVVPLAGFALVAGHLWPLYFGFRGGGGIAPAIGFLLPLFPAATLLSVGIGLGVAALYHFAYFRPRRQGIYPFPFGAIFGLGALLLLSRHDPAALWTAALIAAAMLARGLALLKSPVRRRA
jgi:glycerol-3-phosphate acyltransferase PlsY